MGNKFFEGFSKMDEIPEKEQEILDRFYMMVGKLFVVTDLKKKELVKFKKEFEDCAIDVRYMYDKGEFEIGHRIMCNFLMKMQKMREW